MLAAAATVCGLNLYSLILDNLLNMRYTGYTVETAYELMYDPPPLSPWEQFWRGPWGAVLSVTILFAATVLAILCPAFIPYYINGLIWTAVGLGISAVVAGYSSWRVGHGFWNGFGQSLHNEFSCSFAFGMAIAMVTFGLSQAVQAISKAIRSAKAAKMAIDTPYGKAIQSNSSEALKVRNYVDNGGRIYKAGKLGRSNTTNSQFWAPENPLNPGYANKYGVDFADMDFIIGGRLQPGVQYITRSAPGLGLNVGGAIEIVDNSNSILLDFFYML